MVNIGQKLREERMRQGISIDQAAESTKIRKSFLTAIERGEYQKLPSPAYTQGFVQNYARFLGLPKHDVLPLLKREYDQKRAFDVLPKGFTRSTPIARRHLRLQQTVFVVIGIVVLFVAYLLFQARYLFIHPPLHITSPDAKATVYQDVTVSGDTDPNATVYINHVLVALDDKGIFAKQFSVFPGKTTFVVTARNRLGKETTIERTVQVSTRP